MELRDRLTADLTKAIKAKEGVRVSVLRMVRAAVLNKDKSGSGPASEAEITGIIQNQIKQRQESETAFRNAERNEAADKEAEEARLLKSYLPEQLSEEALAQLIDETIMAVNASSPRDMGKVMGSLKEKTAGRADMKQVSGLVKTRLLQH